MSVTISKIRAQFQGATRVKKPNLGKNVKHTHTLLASDLSIAALQQLFPYIYWNIAFKENKRWRLARGDILLSPSIRSTIDEIPQIRNDLDFDETKVPMNRSFYPKQTPLDCLIKYIHEKFDLEHPGRLQLSEDSEHVTHVPEGTIKGVPYYTLMHGPHTLATNFVVVHSETPAWYDSMDVMAYMAMIHSERRHRNLNSTVYGLSTNSKEYWFYQIDSEGKWSYIVVKDEDWTGQVDCLQEVAGLIAYIFQKAIVLSQREEKERLRRQDLKSSGRSPGNNVSQR